MEQSQLATSFVFLQQQDLMGELTDWGDPTVLLPVQLLRTAYMYFETTSHYALSLLCSGMRRCKEFGDFAFFHFKSENVIMIST